MSDLIAWNRRTRAAVAIRKSWTRVRAFILGQGLSHEAAQWSHGFTMHGQYDNGEAAAFKAEGCPIYAALVPVANRAYHERWHIAGSV